MGSSSADVDRLIQAARLHLAKGEFHEAIEQASEVIRRDSKQPAAYLVRAEAHRKLKRPDRALADLAVAIRLDPNQPGPYVIRAEILKRRNMFDQAIADASHAIIIDARSAAAYSIRAECRSAIGDHEGAIEDVQEMVQIDPTRPIPDLRAKSVSGDPNPAMESEDERFWKQSGSKASNDRTVFADGKPVDKSYRARRVISDDDAPEVLGVASGYKPETIGRPLPRIRAASKRSDRPWLWIGIGLACAGLIGYLAANRGRIEHDPVNALSLSRTTSDPVEAPSPSETAARGPTSRQSLNPSVSPVPAEIAWTYLVDLQYSEVRHHRGWWSVSGELVLEGAPGEPDVRRPLQFEGKHSTHGIYLCARPYDNVVIKYKLSKRFSAFRSQVVIPEMFPWQGNPSTPLVFKILGDGRLLWQSRPLGRKGDNQACTVSVQNVDQLSLMIDCPGSENWGLGAWIEPQLKAATPSETVASQLTSRQSLNPSAPSQEMVRPTPREMNQSQNGIKVHFNGRTWTNSLGMKFVHIEPGKFVMGSTEGEAEQPCHLVEITKAFSLGDCEVTQGKYLEVMGVDPSNFKGSDDLPVEQVSWFDAVRFCNKLSKKERRTPCYSINGGDVAVVPGDGYRLPTEAEWEYACRAGSTTRFPFGDDEAELSESAWFAGNAGKQTHPVGQKRPNGWGLHDMLGNVAEWCQDGYDARYYAKSPPADPSGPSGMTSRVIRGGSGGDSPTVCRPAFRFTSTPGYLYGNLGFRLASVRSE